jgi:cysteine desulfurase
MPSSIYLDHNATSPLCAAARDAMRRHMDDVAAQGNPSSPHAAGHAARIRLEEARETLAGFLGGGSEEIVFVSGGTEAVNLAIMGHARAARQPGHVVTSAVEHPAVLESCAALQRLGWEIARVGVDANGVIDPEEIRAAIGPRTTLVSIMAANNETGVMQPIPEIASIAREHGVAMHVDAVQTAPWMPLDVDDPPVDYVSISSHKLAGPAGIGVLWVREGTPIAALLAGGSQERRRRPGTEPVLLACGFAAAARDLLADAGRTRRIRALRDHLEGAIARRARGARDLSVHGASVMRLPNTTSLMAAGMDHETLVVKLDLMGIAVSTGSACSTGSARPSHVLTAMGLTPECSRSTIRISLGRGTTAAEIDRAVEAIASAIGAPSSAPPGRIEAGRSDTARKVG